MMINTVTTIITIVRIIVNVLRTMLYIDIKITQM